MRVTHTRPPTHKRRAEPQSNIADINKTERAQLSAQGRGCATLLRRLQEEHPQIVAHLLQKGVDGAKASD